MAALLADGGPTEPLPPLVRGHYLRSLVEWSTGALTKDGGGGKGSKKRKQQQKGQEQEAGGGGGGAPHGAHPARLEPRCWAVLVAVLGSGANAPGQPLPAALLPAATATMQLAEGGALGGEQRAQEELLAQVAALLRLLNRKFAAGFRPSIEHAVGAAEAALSGHAAAAAEGFAAWAPAATAAAQLLLAAAGGHPSPRKVWDAAVPRLLPPLAQAGFAAEPGTHAAELASCCRQVLEAVLLSQQHVAALAAAAAAEMAAAVAEASSADGAAAEAAAQAAAEGMQVDGEKEEGGGTAAAGSGSQSKKQQQGYATQLFSALRAQVAAGDVPLAALPWLAGRFCTALKQHRRAAETGEAIGSRAAVVTRGLACVSLAWHKRRGWLAGALCA